MKKNFKRRDFIKKAGVAAAAATAVSLFLLQQSPPIGLKLTALQHGVEDILV
jgi:hypothetical protein